MKIFSYYRMKKKRKVKVVKEMSFFCLIATHYSTTYISNGAQCWGRGGKKAYVLIYDDFRI